MSCERFEERLHDLLDRRLSGEEEAELRVHLASCGRCSETLRDLEELLVMTRSMSEEAPPAGFADEVMRSVAADGARARRSRFRLVSLGALGSIAAGLLVFVMYQSPTVSLKSSPAAGEVSLAKASDKELVPEAERLRFAPAPVVEKNAFAKDDQSESDEKVAAGLESALESESLAEGNAPMRSLAAESKQDERKDADESRRAKEAQPKAPPSPSEETFYAFVEKPQAEQQLRDSLKVLDKTLTQKMKSEVVTDGKAQEKAQDGAQKNENADGFAMGIPMERVESMNRTIRYRIPRSQLAGLQEQWKKIPGLRVQEAPPPAAVAGKIALGRSGGAPAKDPAPSTAGTSPVEALKPPVPEVAKKGHGGVYRGPADTVPPGGAAALGAEEWIEIVITILPATPAEKPPK